MKKSKRLLNCMHLTVLLYIFCFSGIMGLQWAKHLGSSVKVTINDYNENSVTLIQENCHLNKMKVVMNSKGGDECDATVEEHFLPAVEVTKMDANVLMHLRAFDFM